MKYALPHTALAPLLAIVCSFGLSACGGDTIVRDDDLTIDAAIEGTVTDGLTHAPIKGAVVTVPGTKDASADTDAHGFYHLPVDGVGDHTVFVQYAGYALAKYRVRAALEPGAPGKLALTAVSDSRLYPMTGVLRGRVTSGGPRDTIKGARVLVQFTDTTDPIEDGSLKVETTTAADGTFELDKLPAGSPQTRVTVFPADIDGDDEPDTATFSDYVKGGSGNNSLLPDSQNYMEISVDQFVADKVIWSNLDDSPVIAADAALSLTFARPMSTIEDATTVTLRQDNNALEGIGVDKSWSDDGLTLTITPREPLVSGESYNLSVQAQSVAGSAVSYTRAFNVASADAPAEPVAGLRIIDRDPIPWSQRSFTLTWERSADAEGYRVLARNTQRQTTWVSLFDGVVSAFDAPQVLVNLPDSFNTFPSDNVFSATGFGTIVQFAVQPFNGKNDGPLPSKDSQLATLADTVCPQLSVLQSATSDNTSGTTVKKFYFTVRSTNGEPLADASVAKFTFANGTSSATSYTLNTKPEIRRISASTFEYWYEVPAGDSPVGNQVTVSLSKVTDTSGNAPDGTLTCPNEIKTALF